MATIPDIPPLPLCKDCRYMLPGNQPDEPFCTSPKRGTVVSLVTGLNTPRLVFCTTHRSLTDPEADQLGGCGRQGRFFEPKEKTS